jgi:thiol-disulfide isomerase/thioredoxin
LNGFAAQVAKRDRDGDGAVTVAEYGDLGPGYMFDAFDINRDGIVRSHELVAAKRIAQFGEIDEPKTIEQRVALAKRFRAEVPGTIPVLIDDIDNRVGKQLGELPNSAHVIGRDGKVTMKIAWAAVGEVERELVKLAGGQAPAVPAADLSLLAGKLGGAKPVLVEFTAPGCEACVKIQPTLAEPDVAKALERYEVVKLGVDVDPAWRLFEQLDLAATPAFVVIGSDGKLKNQIQGSATREQLLAFLK